MKYIIIIFATLIITVFSFRTEDKTLPSEEAPPGPNAARVENGSFERPEVGSYEIFPGSVAGWTVAQNRIEIIDESYDNRFTARSGSQVLHLNDAGAIYQNVQTDSDSTYQLTFYFYGDADESATMNLTVKAGSAGESYEISPEQSTYQRQTMRFKGAADADLTRITLTSTTGGPIIDDVNVEVTDS